MRNCREILVIGKNVLCCAVVTALPSFCTWLPYNWTLLLLVLLAYLLQVCLTMFVLDALIVSVSIWIVNNVCIFCVLSLVKPTKMS